jgi:hypothetical protein
MMVRNRNGIMVAVVLALVMISGCTPAVYSLPSTMAQLQAGGYKGGRTIGTTATGEQRENPNYEIWWKEFRQQTRIHHYCFVPGPSMASYGYNWKIAVFVDDRQAWEYQSGPLAGEATGRTGISCAETSPLPEGRVNWRVWYVRWN